MHHDDIAEVIPVRICPDLSLRLGLAALPDLVATVDQPATTEVSDVEETLLEPEEIGAEER